MRVRPPSIGKTVTGPSKCSSVTVGGSTGSAKGPASQGVRKDGDDHSRKRRPSIQFVWKRPSHPDQDHSRSSVPWWVVVSCQTRVPSTAPPPCAAPSAFGPPGPAGAGGAAGPPPAAAGE